jgi:hypothetical protein
MSVRPITFNADGSIDVYVDELGHSGTIPAADIAWAADPMTGAEDHNHIVLTCPDGCGSASNWPVGGGADAAVGQELFVRKINLEGCACPDVTQPDPPTDAIAHVKELVTAMDGAERWALDDAQLLEVLSAT